MKTNHPKSADAGAGAAPIRPEILASKLAAIRNYEHPKLLRQITDRPRLVEMLWAIQRESLQPGGLVKFVVDELLIEFPERIGTPTLLRAPAGELSLEQKITIWRELPPYARPTIPDDAPPTLGDMLSEVTPCEEQAKERESLRSFLKPFGRDFFQSLCRTFAAQRLPGFLASLCTEKGKEFVPGEEFNEGAVIGSGGVAKLTWSIVAETWYFCDPIDAVLELMDRRGPRVQKRLAMTEVAKQVFEALDFAFAEKVMVRIEGDSRFGKTEAMETWCDMRPGLARLVRVPCDNSMGSLLKRFGEAVGIDCSYGSNTSRLKERIEYVIQHSGLFFVLDEGSFLLPQNYTATTPPQRLNWVRTEIVDRELPLAIAVTPQTFKPSVERFVKKTAYAMDQFFGRTFMTRRLPSTLSEGDLIAVARIHFPELSEAALGYIASEARLSQNYLQAVEAVARLARFAAARRHGRITVRDIETAVADVLPRRQMAAAGQPSKPVQQPNVETSQPPFRGAARGVHPPRIVDVPALNLGNRSFREADPEIELAEPVSAGS